MHSRCHDDGQWVGIIGWRMKQESRREEDPVLVSLVSIIVGD